LGNAEKRFERFLPKTLSASGFSRLREKTEPKIFSLGHTPDEQNNVFFFAPLRRGGEKYGARIFRNHKPMP
jgi:hypothetical protein